MRMMLLGFISIASLLVTALLPVPATATEAVLPVSAELRDTGWFAYVSRHPDGALQGTAMSSWRNESGGPRTAWLACLDDHWSVGFLGAWGPKWGRLIAWAEEGEFVDKGSFGPIEDSPIVIYKAPQAVAGRADWTSGNISVAAAPTVIF